uniref:Uncharacterized protein n=1 Tax=Oryza meridionalis TaxID=40149 RepID=A0A0E0EN36_9ORYZ
MVRRGLKQKRRYFFRSCRPRVLRCWRWQGSEDLAFAVAAKMEAKPTPSLPLPLPSKQRGATVAVATTHARVGAFLPPTNSPRLSPPRRRSPAAAAAGIFRRIVWYCAGHTVDFRLYDYL